MCELARGGQTLAGGVQLKVRWPLSQGIAVAQETLQGCGFRMVEGKARVGSRTNLGSNLKLPNNLVVVVAGRGTLRQVTLSPLSLVPHL